MKNYLPLFCVALLIGGCGKYESMDEAKTACYEWRDNGEVIKFKYVWSSYMTGKSVGSKVLKNRKCENEQTTRQYLGKEGEFTEQDRRGAGKHFKEGLSSAHPKPATNYKVVERFRY